MTIFLDGYYEMLIKIGVLLSKRLHVVVEKRLRLDEIYGSLTIFVCSIRLDIVVLVHLLLVSKGDGGERVCSFGFIVSEVVMGSLVRPRDLV